MTDITWNGASGDWTEAGNWTPSQVPTSGDNATIAGSGTISVDVSSGESVTASGILLDNANATLEIDGLLNAGTIALDAGTLANNGTIADGTLVLNGGSFSSAGGVLQGDTIQGTLEVGGSDTVLVQDGLTVLASDGTSPGTVTVDGSYATLQFNDTETFDNATLVLGSADGIDMLDTEGTLTIGSAATIEAAATIASDMILGNGTLINDGTILADAASGTLAIEPTSFINNGVIAVSGGDELDIEPTATFANTGSITVGSGSTLAIQDLTAFTNTGSITIESGGTLSLDTYASALSTAQSAGGSVEVDGLLALNGGTITVSADSAFATLTNNGTIADGTLVLNGGSFSSAGGVLQGDTIQGMLEIGGSDTVLVQDGLTVLASDGTSPGTVTVDGSYATLQFNDTETFDNATLVLGGADGIDMLDTEGTLTIGSAATIETAATIASDMILGNGTLINDGTILADAASGTLAIEPTSFINNGVIAVSGGDELDIEPTATFANTGSITVGSGSTLAIQDLTAFTNTGSITVESGGTLSLDTYASALSTAQSADGSVEVDGLLALNGGTITVSADSAFATLTNNGTIADGTLVLNGGSFSSAGGVLQGDTIQGRLEIGGSDTVLVQDGLTVLASDGTSPGTVTVDGSYATLQFNDTETFDNATLVLGSADGIDMLDTEGTLTIGSAATIEAAATIASDMILGNGTLINDGTILADAASGTLAIEPTSFINNGVIAVSGGDELDIEPTATFANTGSITVGSGSTLAIQDLTAFSNTGSITVESGGTLSLDTYASALSTAQSAGGSVEVDGLLALNGGTITVSADSAFATLTNNGTIADGTLVLNGGSFSSAGGVLQGDTIQGRLEIGGSDTVLVQDGLTVLASDGTSPGTVTVDGSYATLQFNDTETFDNATLVLGSADGIDMLDTEGTLTIGSAATIEAAATIASDMILGNGTLINDGTILADAASGTLAIEPTSFINNGVIAVSGGDELDIEPTATFANTGSITVGSGSTLAIQDLTAFSNTGSITVESGGTLSLDTYASALSTAQSAGGSVEVDGLLALNGGTITVSADSAFATLTNNGTIADGTLVLNGGSFSSAGGVLQGDTIQGMLEIGGSDTVLVQDGLTVLASDGTSPGTVTVDGSYATLQFNDTETFDNATLVLGGADGIDMLDTEGTLTIGSAATIETAATIASDMILGNGTLINDGTILADAASGTLAIEPTSFINNGVIAVSGGDELDIEPTATFANTGTITVGSGSTLAIQYVPTVSNTGTILVQGGSLSADHSISGTGSITLSDGATASLAGAAAGQTVTFADSTDSLTLTAPADFAATIKGFQSGDSITLDGVSGATESYANGVLTVTEGGTTVASLAISGDYQTSDFIAIESGGNLVIETSVLPCFAAGTRIRTDQGEVAVEALKVGDQVMTVTEGAPQHATITWIGHRAVDLARHAEPERVRPVRILRGAFGDNMPARDLVLSPDHAIFAEGVLVPVKYLINGTTIRFDHAIKRITYYHVELTQHEVLLAEGLPAESYLETGGRRMFENGGLPVALHPDFAPMAWDVLGCAPLMVTGPEVDAIAARLARRAESAQAA